VVEGAVRVLRKTMLKAEFLKVKPRCCPERIVPPTPFYLTLNLVHLTLLQGYPNRWLRTTLG
jgi:hypothetical protein